MSTFDIQISKVLCPTGLSAAGVEPNAYAAQRHPSRENRMNLAKIPCRGHLQGQTPIEPLKNFSAALGGKIHFWIKRDDLPPGCGGGNKTRKLDFSFVEAIAQGADAVMTCGAVQSNHCRLTLAWAVKEGLDCQLVLEERVKDSDDPNASGNNFLFRLMGVETDRRCRRCGAVSGPGCRQAEMTGDDGHG
jgi:hypothetical protein